MWRFAFWLLCVGEALTTTLQPLAGIHVGFTFAVAMAIFLTTAALALAPSLTPLRGVAPPLVSTSEPLDLGKALEAPGTTLLVLGTYPADFNMIEYAQRLTHYLPALKERASRVCFAP